MQVIENINPGKPVRTFALHLTDREMHVLARSLERVTPANDMRTEFWDIFTKITLANNANDGA